MHQKMSRIARDQHTIRMMISLYCRRHLHHSEPSAEYRALSDYACRRLQHCRWGEAKPACKDCPTHCYAPDKRQKMHEIMRWTGPRMLFYSPRATMRHLGQCISSILAKLRARR